MLTVIISSLFLIACFADNQDWAQLGRYRDSNEQLAKLPAGTNQVVWMGDSITDVWDLKHWFPNKPYVNRGIFAQTTPQMLVRFHEDVIDLKPKVVMILAGVNDIGGNTGPTPDVIIENNLASMAAIALNYKIKVVMSTILPVCGGVTNVIPPSRISAVNKWIKNYASDTKNVFYLDYFSAVVDKDGLLKSNLANDCLHPTPQGYDLMAPLAQAAIDQALKEEWKEELKEDWKQSNYGVKFLLWILFPMGIVVFAGIIFSKKLLRKRLGSKHPNVRPHELTEAEA